MKQFKMNHEKNDTAEKEEKRGALKAGVAAYIDTVEPKTKLETICEEIMKLMREQMAGTEIEGMEPDESLKEQVKLKIGAWAKEKEWSVETHIGELPIFIRAFIVSCAMLIFKTRMEDTTEKTQAFRDKIASQWAEMQG